VGGADQVKRCIGRLTGAHDDLVNATKSEAMSIHKAVKKLAIKKLSKATVGLTVTCTWETKTTGA
jgi:hypothetical protein